MRTRQRGLSLIEALVILAIVTLTITLTIPAFANINRKQALRAAAAQLRVIFHHTRQRSITMRVNCGLKFSELAGVWHFAVYEDSDGDGIRNDDITKGIDRLIEPPRPLFREWPVATIGLLDEKVKDADGDPVKTPVTFNRTTICSFTPRGESTPGTIYLTDSRDLWCVRVYGASAKIRTLRYDAAAKKWIQQ